MAEKPLNLDYIERGTYMESPNGRRYYVSDFDHDARGTYLWLLADGAKRRRRLYQDQVPDGWTVAAKPERAPAAPTAPAAPAAPARTVSEPRENREQRASGNLEMMRILGVTNEEAQLLLGKLASSRDMAPALAWLEASRNDRLTGRAGTPAGCLCGYQADDARDLAEHITTAARCTDEDHAAAQ